MCSRVLWIEKGVQKIFDNSDKVCDLYMDMKRIGMNELLDHYDKNSEGIKGIESNENKIIPKISFKKSELMSDEFEIISGYFQDNYGNVTTKLVVDEEFTTHVFVKFNIDMSNIIIGFVLENSKGIPLYDINNYINQQQGVYGKKGEILEIVYKYKMPRLMKGMYIVSIAIAQGTQEKHVMKTWLHGTNEIEIVNTGYNSSYIEIPSDIDVNYYKEENIAII
jgi:teichoic acid transport system ATP-binding protein